MNKNYFAYTRVSTTKQGEGVSLEAQREAIAQFAEKNELHINEWFEEKETAAKLGRPVFTDMVQKLQLQKAQGLLMHKIDRSARNFRDWATIGELHDAGIDVQFVAENIDFTSNSGRLAANIQAVFAENYIRNLRQEAEKGIQGRLKQGLYPLKAPIGYVDNGGGEPKTIDPVRGPLIRQMFELYASGQYSMHSLADEMNRRGLTGRLGKKIYKSKVDRILSNLFYMGIIEIRTTGQTYPGIHEPLISAELFKKVQQRRLGKFNKKNTRNNFLYRGQFKCQNCNNSMIGEKQKGHVYYRCQTKDCPTNCIRETVIEEFVLDKFNALAIRTGDWEKFADKFRNRVSDLSTSPNGSSIHIRLAEIDQQQDNLTQYLLKGVLDDETYKRKQKELIIARTALNEEAEQQHNRVDIQRHIEQFLELVKNLATTYQMAIPGERRQLLEICFSNRTILDKTPCVTTQNWLVQSQNHKCVPYCGLCEDKNRRNPDIPEITCDEDLEHLLPPELKALVDVCNQINSRTLNSSKAQPGVR